ncbi:hypothetical protein EDB82DRAFT_572328 [Fusarium venenatum]|uniref:uncharacterized protein n=1 Tax=Fusarium venenatum TaxID=56646 RepID=UPI001DAE1465|nr:hypothetical protein EDB82DRAFT_572328 [Fusarium venenatum]
MAPHSISQTNQQCSRGDSGALCMRIKVSNTQDEEDPDLDPNSTDGHHAKRKRQPNPTAKQTWKDTLQRMSIDELGSAKIKRISGLVAEIQFSYLSEKIIVTSASVKFLDVLGDYLPRLAPELTMVRFDGRITSVDDRTEIADRFNSEGRGIDMLLLSASCGGTGLNLHGGSHAIITE